MLLKISMKSQRCRAVFIDRFSKLGGKAKAFLEGIGNNAMEFIGKLMSAISGGVFELAKTGGHKAGQAIFKFLEAMEGDWRRRRNRCRNGTCRSGFGSRFRWCW